MRTFKRGRLPLRPHDGLGRGPGLQLVLDGSPVRAFTGETLAAVIMAAEGPETRRTASGAARGVYCGMGVCFDCLVVVNGVPNTRACMTLAAEGMRVERQVGAGAPR